MPEPAEYPHILKIALRVPSRERLQALLANASIDFGCRVAGRVADDGAIVLDAFVPAALVDSLRADGLEVEIVQDVTEAVRARQAEVGRADLFERGRPSRRGLVLDRPLPSDRPAAE
jgi:hypothetical protein